MKQALWFLFYVASALACVAAVALTYVMAYRAGGAEQRAFEAQCKTPGIRCLVQVTPTYLETHRDIEMLPFATYEWKDDDGGLR